MEIRRGVVIEVWFFAGGGDPAFQPRPDSRRMEDLTGSEVGEFESRRSLRGDSAWFLCELIVGNDGGGVELVVSSTSAISVVERGKRRCLE